MCGWCGASCAHTQTYKLRAVSKKSLRLVATLMENDKRHVGKRFADLPPFPRTSLVLLVVPTWVYYSTQRLQSPPVASHVAGCCRAIVVVVVVSFVATRGQWQWAGAAAVQVYFTFGFGHRKSLAASCGIALSFSACACVQPARACLGLSLVLSLSLSCLQHYRINFFWALICLRCRQATAIECCH